MTGFHDANFRGKRWLCAIGAAVFLCTLSAVCEEAVPPELKNLPKLDCRSMLIPKEYSTHGSGYTAITVGRDGKVYVGSARYCDYGYWISCDPRTRKVEPVVNIRQLVAEDLYDVNTQGKTHTKLFLGPDGTIYGGTKQGHELFDTRPEIGEEAGGYPGGHLLTYNPETGVSQDLGIIRAQDGLMNGILDPVRRRIYFKTEPRMHFVYYEMDTHQVVDKGRVGTWGRYIDMDAKGNVWIPNHGVMTEYDAERDEIIDYHVQVDGGGRPYEKPYACVMGPEGDKLYGGDHRTIQEFDLERAANGLIPMRYVCRAVPEPFEQSSDIHTMICDTKGRVYWPAAVDVPNSAKQLLMMRYTPKRGELECLGYCIDADLPKQENVAIQGSAFDTEGSLYLFALYPLRVIEFPKLAKR
ncbi:MAG TPA: hypothetical protein PLZ55_04915 [bacterium]|nr:hypothetical protein [bacterium]HQO34310.1 hypothetical protein [bacterium]